MSGDEPQIGPQAPADALQAALLALKPEGCTSIYASWCYGFDCTMVFAIDGKSEVATGRDRTSFAEAFAAADAKRVAMIAKSKRGRDHAAAEFGALFGAMAL